MRKKANPLLSAYRKNGAPAAIDKLDKIRRSKPDRLSDDDVLELIDTFIQDGVDINSRNKDGEGILHLYYSPTVIKKVTDAGGNVNIEDIEGTPPLENFVVSSAEWTDMYTVCDEGSEEWQDAVAALGQPLPSVDMDEYYETVKLYLELGADPNKGLLIPGIVWPASIWDYEETERPAQNILKVLELALKYGDVNTVANGDTAFGLVCTRFTETTMGVSMPENSLYIPALRMLVSAGADINVQVDPKTGKDTAIELLPADLQEELRQLAKQ